MNSLQYDSGIKYIGTHKIKRQKNKLIMSKSDLYSKQVVTLTLLREFVYLSRDAQVKDLMLK